MSPVSRKVACHCRENSCKRKERVNGTCCKGFLTYIFWCHWAWSPERTRQPCALRPLKLSADDHCAWVSSLSSVNCSQCASCVCAFFLCLLQGSVKPLYIKYQNLQGNLGRWMNNLVFTCKILPPNTNNLRMTPGWDTKCKGSPECSWFCHMPLLTFDSAFR